jgi:hypothetical protein
MVNATTLPDLPDPESITDEESASDALCHTLAVVATTNRKLAIASEDRPGEPIENLSTTHEHLKGLFKELHVLLPRIASFRADMTGWSFTVGMSDTLTVNFTNKHAQTGPDSGIPGQDIDVSG